MQNEESVQNLDSRHLTAAAIDHDKGISKASSGTRRKSPIPDSNLGAPSSSMNNSQADATAIAIADSAGVFPLSAINEDQVQSWAGALVDGTAISWIFEALQSSFGGKGQTLTLTPARSWQSSEHLTRNEVVSSHPYTCHTEIIGNSHETSYVFQSWQIFHHPFP